MDKLIDSMSFSEDWRVTLLGAESSGLEKSAAADEVLSFTKDMAKDDSKFYLHINAMGAGEYYGSNRNGDYFPEDNLIQWHKTFETSPAHVYRHHVNKNPEIAIGKVIYAYYNPRMHRVELIAEVDKVRGAEELRAIEAGKFPMTSMACNTPYDVCSICGNKAHNRAEYCQHLNGQLNHTMPDGRRVMSLNVGPLKFFDISIVIRPADITSSVLQKVASAEDMPAVSSVEAAELEGVQYEKKASIKTASVEKVADLIKEIPGEIKGGSPVLEDILKQVKDPEDSMLKILKAYSTEDILSTFAFLGMNPSLSFLVKILAGKQGNVKEHEVADQAISSLHEFGVEAIPEDAGDLVPDIQDPSPNTFLIKELAPYVPGGSYGKQYVEKRASHDGYANFQVGRGRVEPSVFFPEKPEKPSNSLLKLAGAAIIAKIMISTMVGMQKAAGLSPGVEKSAELTVKLMDLAVRNELKGMRNA